MLKTIAIYFLTPLAISASIYASFAGEAEVKTYVVSKPSSSTSGRLSVFADAEERKGEIECSDHAIYLKVDGYDVDFDVDGKTSLAEQLHRCHAAEDALAKATAKDRVEITLSINPDYPALVSIKQGKTTIVD